MSSNQETSVNQGSPNAQISPAVVAALTNAAASGEPPITLGALDSNQIMSLLRHLPGVFNKVCGYPFPTLSGRYWSIVGAVAEKV